ncbi:MAG: hypothetical protein ACFBSD_10755 [Paracoccaceae bacterium]
MHTPTHLVAAVVLAYAGAVILWHFGQSEGATGLIGLASGYALAGWGFALRRRARALDAARQAPDRRRAEDMLEA